ncbi:putative bifunctional diguanylate cyclase/phosphodiesterase [Paractinoplanes rishiriensis]|uniref:putative bifunctional diguanylate cyclase/phosphodiesterase n=1 Tax=Paractinoplanes rishiriensis TaxID=1050105 RepID=UPI0023B20973|nr:EAL domain-containing protein [Actinoplanes rishiriensis]
MTDRWPPAPRRYVYATCGIVALSMLWYVAGLLVGAGPEILAYLPAPIASAVGAVAVAALLRKIPMDPAARQFWRLILVLEVCVALGRGIFCVQTFATYPAGPPAPLISMPLLLAGLLAAIVALCRVPLGRVDRADRWKQWLDRAVAFGGCITLFVFAVVAPLHHRPDPWSMGAVLMAGLTVVMSAIGICRVVSVPGGPVDRVAVRLVACSGLATAVYAMLNAQFGAGAATLGQAVVLPFGPLLIVLAVHRHWSAAGARTQRESWLPYLTVLAVDVPLVVTVFLPMHWPDRLVVVLAVAVTLLATARQFVAYRENRRLIRAQRESEERLRHDATHDALTGLPNRGLFRERLAAALGAEGATVVIVDLDDFRTVNESLGHEVGDDLLIAVAEELRATVGSAGLPARLGGDEFAVLVTDPEVCAEDLVARITTVLGGSLSRHRLLMHASAGIATAPAGTALDHVMRDADTALHAAKQRGKDNWVRFAAGMERPVHADAQLGAELRRGLDDGEFRVVYQPLVDLNRNLVTGVEALVRWAHPTRGMVSPADFIPVAERTGLIVPLGRFVLRETCRQAAAWLAEFGPEVVQKAGPNVSARQLHDPDFVDDVRAALADSGLPGEFLVLELTESAVLRGQQVSRALHELHGMGVRLALDDFGTGESSLSLLRAFPASIVKLDKSFVDGIELDEPGSPAAMARQAVARAVIQMAGALDLDTVAEGIENAEQAERLRQLGYSLGQGFHLAKPMSPEAVTRMLADQMPADQMPADQMPADQHHTAAA